MPNSLPRNPLLLSPAHLEIIYPLPEFKITSHIGPSISQMLNNLIEYDELTLLKIFTCQFYPQYIL